MVDEMIIPKEAIRMNHGTNSITIFTEYITGINGRIELYGHEIYPTNEDPNTKLLIEIRFIVIHPSLLSSIEQENYKKQIHNNYPLLSKLISQLVNKLKSILTTNPEPCPTEHIPTLELNVNTYGSTLKIQIDITDTNREKINLTELVLLQEIMDSLITIHKEFTSYFVQVHKSRIYVTNIEYAQEVVNKEYYPLSSIEII